MAAAPDRRRANRPGEPYAPAVEHVGQVWRVRSAAVARQVLRERRHTTQAGFTAEAIPKGYLKHHPILISDGPQHDEQRTKVARFFAPKVVAQRYTALMESCADRLLEEAGSGTLRLDELALLYTVEVTAEAVGLTESAVPAMARLVQCDGQKSLCKCGEVLLEAFWLPGRGLVEIRFGQRFEKFQIAASEL